MMLIMPLVTFALILVSFNPLLGYSNLNVNYSISTTLNCSYATRETSVSIIYEMCVAVVVSATALIYLVTVQERDNRELFFWTKLLQVKQQNLLKQVDPFSPDQLQQWFESSIRSQTASSASIDINSTILLKNFESSTSITKTHPILVESPSCYKHAMSLAASINDGLNFSQNGSFLNGHSPDQRREFWDIPEENLRLEQAVAAGGAGTVWRAILDGKVVAAKQIRALSDFMMQDYGIQELASEVRILGQLNHINILKFLGLCIKHPEDEDEPVSVLIVTEWCSQNLRDWITADSKHSNIATKSATIAMAANFNVENPVNNGDQNRAITHARKILKHSSNRDCCDVALQVSTGMHYLHSRGVIHRDLKPENVLITTDGRACICDFGLSVGLVKGRSNAVSNTVTGTPGYIAPEIYFASQLRKCEPKRKHNLSSNNYSKKTTTNTSNSTLTSSYSFSSSLSPLAAKMPIMSTESASSSSSTTVSSTSATLVEKEDHIDEVTITNKIDVYAFGIILWEIFTDGVFEFEDIQLHLTDHRNAITERSSKSTNDHQNMFAAIVETLPIPDAESLRSGCVHEIETCMKACWKPEADKRPSFANIFKTLGFALKRYENNSRSRISNNGRSHSVSDHGFTTERSNKSSFRSNRARAVTSATQRSSSQNIIPLNIVAASEHIDEDFRTRSMSTISVLSTFSSRLRYEYCCRCRKWLQLEMRCFAPCELHFASLDQEEIFLATTLTTPFYFRSVRIALILILALHVFRALYVL